MTSKAMGLFAAATALTMNTYLNPQPKTYIKPPKSKQVRANRAKSKQIRASRKKNRKS